MMTVKLIEPNGSQQIYEADRVWTEHNEAGVQVYAQLDPTHADPKMPNPIVFGPQPGMLYVMNGNGATVASYDLAEAPLRTHVRTNREGTGGPTPEPDRHTSALRRPNMQAHHTP